MWNAHPASYRPHTVNHPYRNRARLPVQCASPTSSTDRPQSLRSHSLHWADLRKEAVSSTHDATRSTAASVRKKVKRPRVPRRYRRQVCSWIPRKLYQDHCPHPTRCRVRCSSAVLRSCYPRSNINRATLLLKLATHQRSLPRHTPSCGSSPRHRYGGPVRRRPVFRCVCAFGLCGHAAQRRDFFFSSK